MSNAGAISRKITIQRRTDTENDFGERVPAWSTLAVVWGQDVTHRGMERFVTDQRLAVVERVVRIRWRSDIRVTDRIVIDDAIHATLGIVKIIEIGRRRYLDIGLRGLANGRAD